MKTLDEEAAEEGLLWDAAETLTKILYRADGPPHNGASNDAHADITNALRQIRDAHTSEEIVRSWVVVTGLTTRLTRK